jgi:hypothetical protein
VSGAKRDFRAGHTADESTRMGGRSAAGNLNDGAETQVWLASSQDEEAMVSGRYFKVKRQQKPVAAALDTKLQDEYIRVCEKLSGVKLPE